MYVAIVLLFLVSAIAFALAFLLYSKQKISLLHAYHMHHIKQEDIPAYCKHMGMGFCVMGAGALLSAILCIALQNMQGMFLFFIALAVSIMLFIHAQKCFQHK